MITNAKNKAGKRKKKKKEPKPEKKLTAVRRKEVLQNRYGIGKQMNHFGANK